MKTTLLQARCITFLAIALTSPLTTARTFTNDKGHKVEATVQGVEGDKVILRTSSGKIARFPMAKLSQEDQQYIKNHPLASLPLINIPKNRVIQLDNKHGKSVYITNTNKQINTKGVIAMYSPDLTQDVFYATVYEGSSSNSRFISHQAKTMLQKPKMSALSGNSKWSDSLILIVRGNGGNIKWGYITHQGKVIVQTDKYSSASRMIDNRAWVSEKQKGSDRILIDEKGNVVKKFGQTLKNYSLFSDGISLISTGEAKTYKSFYIDTTGEKAFPFEGNNVDKIHPFANGYAIAKNGILLPNGNWSVPPSKDYTIISKKVTDGVVIIYKTINEAPRTCIMSAATGKITFEVPKDFRLKGSCSDGLIVICNKKTSLYGMIDRTGKTVIPLKYKNIKSSLAGFINFTDKEGKSSYMNHSQQIIKPKG